MALAFAHGRVVTAKLQELRNLIHSGERQQVEEFLPTHLELLARTYGGNAKDENLDPTDLFEGSFPLHHAARRGRMHVYSAVASAVQVIR